MTLVAYGSYYDKQDSWDQRNNRVTSVSFPNVFNGRLFIPVDESEISSMIIHSIAVAISKLGLGSKKLSH